jgi:hypothetical protein
MQGRVIALHAIVFTGSTPIGGPMIGWVCEQFGARVGMLVSGVVPLLFAGALLPTLRRVRRSADAAVPSPSVP